LHSKPDFSLGELIPEELAAGRPLPG